MKYLVVILPLLIITGVAVGVFAALNPDGLNGIVQPEMVDKYIFLLPVVIVGLAILITAVALAPMLRGIFRNMELRKKLEVSGVRAKGLVMNVRDTGASINDNPVVKLDIQIRPGVNTTVQKAVSRVAVPREGDEINVLYDPANPADAVAE